MNDFEPHNLNESTPTDARLDALLDEALAPAPGDPPTQLNQRILAATADRLAELRDDAHGPAVIATIGGGTPWRALAAVLLFALVLGGVWVANQDDPAPPGGDPVGPIVNGSDTATVRVEPVKIEHALTQLAQAELQTDWIDDRLEFLSMQVSWTEDAGLWGDGALESLDTAIAREEFDDLADSLELYF